MATSSSVSVSNGRPAMRCLSVTPSRNSITMKSAILLVDFMNCANVGMVQSRSGLCFTAKAAQDLSIFGHFVGQKLQRNKAIEFGVLGFEYYAHPAGAQLLDDAISFICRITSLNCLRNAVRLKYVIRQINEIA